MTMNSGRLDLRAELWTEHGEWHLLLHAPLWVLEELEEQIRLSEPLRYTDFRPRLILAGGPPLVCGAGPGQPSSLLFETGVGNRVEKTEAATE
jgi:hypothetical protein